MLIAFEGINQSGKSSLSLEFQKHLNGEYMNYCGLMVLDTTKGPFVWTKEPLFTKTSADKLNNFLGPTDQYKREGLFFESRIKHQSFLKDHNTVCDRYVWSGMAYSRVLSPGCFELLRELYQNTELFIQPDLYVYVNAGIDTCIKRDPSLNMDTLLEVWKSFELCYDNLKKIGVPIITLNNDNHTNDPVESMQITLTELKQKFKEHLRVTKTLV